MSSDIQLIKDGARARVIFNRPDKRNALNLAMWAAIPALVADAVIDTNVRLLTVEGAGGAFAAGADIAEFETTYRSRDAALANQVVMQAAMTALEDCPKPTAALIQGACVGGGCGLALCCDLRIADPGARFAITPGKLGLVYGVADTRRLVQAVGLSAAKDILFTGRILGAEEARAMGLIDRIAPDLTAEANALETALRSASAFTATTTKQILRLLREGATTDTDDSRALFASAFEGADFKEGFAAFTEKRAPKFT